VSSPSIMPAKKDFNLSDDDSEVDAVSPLYSEHAAAAAKKPTPARRQPSAKTAKAAARQRAPSAAPSKAELDEDDASDDDATDEMNAQIQEFIEQTKLKREQAQAAKDASKKRKLRATYEAEVEHIVTEYEEDLSKEAAAFEEDLQRHAKKMRVELKKRAESAEDEAVKKTTADVEKLIEAIKQERRRVNSSQTAVEAASGQLLVVFKEKLGEIGRSVEARVASINEAEPALAPINTMLRTIAADLAAELAEADEACEA